MVNQKIKIIIEEIKVANQKYHDIRRFGTTEKILAFNTVKNIGNQAVALAESKEELEALKEVVMCGTDAHREIVRRLNSQE